MTTTTNQFRDAAVEHVEVADPDDPLGMPAYGGPLDRAATLLEPGVYRAFTHWTDGTEGYATLVVEDDTARVEPDVTTIPRDSGWVEDECTEDECKITERHLNHIPPRTEDEFPTYEPYPGAEPVPFRLVRVRAIVDVYAYVPVNYEGYNADDTIEGSVHNDLQDAIKHRAPRLTDWEPGDGMLVTQSVHVDVDKFQHQPGHAHLSSKELTQLVEGTAAETF